MASARSPNDAIGADAARLTGVNACAEALFAGTEFKGVPRSDSVTWGSTGTMSKGVAVGRFTSAASTLRSTTDRISSEACGPPGCTRMPMCATGKKGPWMWNRTPIRSPLPGVLRSTSNGCQRVSVRSSQLPFRAHRHRYSSSIVQGGHLNIANERCSHSQTILGRRHSV